MGFFGVFGSNANRQIVNGFILNSNINQRVIQVLPIAGGWQKVINKFKDDHVSGMRKFPKHDDSVIN